MASRDQLKQVASRCSQYGFGGGESFTSGTGDVASSCENCKHFSSSHKCELNLTDKILSNLDEKLDF